RVCSSGPATSAASTTPSRPPRDDYARSIAPAREPECAPRWPSREPPSTAARWARPIGYSRPKSRAPPSRPRACRPPDTADCQGGHARAFRGSAASARTLGRMDFTGAGTAIMLALAAVLWFLYLLPSWMRRREFLATERNATRLQRAIRVLAETAEAPAELRVEANAREVARTERLLAQERRRVEAATRAELQAAELRARAAETQAAEIARAARRDAPIPAPIAQRADAADVTPVLLAFARLRRARRVAGLLLLAAVTVGAVQLWLMATTGI